MSPYFEQTLLAGKPFEVSPILDLEIKQTRRNGSKKKRQSVESGGERRPTIAMVIADDDRTLNQKIVREKLVWTQFIPNIKVALARNILFLPPADEFSWSPVDNQSY
eukprot:m.455258 g.455258  ORF g.455258 m.455258 type:complete len:107 (-) comp56958_c1_seq27:1517-1837(-)